MVLPEQVQEYFNFQNWRSKICVYSGASKKGQVRKSEKAEGTVTNPAFSF